MVQNMLAKERQSFWKKTGYTKTYPSLSNDETTDRRKSI